MPRLLRKVSVGRTVFLELNVMQSQNEQGLLVMRMDTNEGQELSGRQDPCKTGQQLEMERVWAMEAK